MPSETDTCRHSLAKYCQEDNGLDIGYGGKRPIVDHAITMDYAKEIKEWPLNLFWDAKNLPFAHDTLSWIFSSHAIEDFEDTAAVIFEWLRVIKPGGYLVLFAPDQQLYLAHCRANGTMDNKAHKHSDFGLAYVKDRLPENARIVHEQNAPTLTNPYSFELVCVKL